MPHEGASSSAGIAAASGDTECVWAVFYDMALGEGEAEFPHCCYCQQDRQRASYHLHPSLLRPDQHQHCRAEQDAAHASSNQAYVLVIVLICFSGLVL